MTAEEARSRRQDMVEHQLRARHIRDSRVLDAMARVPRERFVPAAMRARAYDDAPLVVEEDRTFFRSHMSWTIAKVSVVQEGARPGG